METGVETRVENRVENRVETRVETQKKTPVETETTDSVVPRRMSERLRTRKQRTAIDSSNSAPQPDVNYSIGSNVQINYKGKVLTTGIFLNATVTHLGVGDDPSMVVQIDPNQRHHGHSVTLQNRFDPSEVQLRRHNPESRRRSMRPDKKQKEKNQKTQPESDNTQRRKLRKRNITKTAK
jgi:hypothetical protein